MVSHNVQVGQWTMVAVSGEKGTVDTSFSDDGNADDPRD
jgi:hypothetical protein